MTSVFDIGTVGVDENGELVIDFTTEFLEMPVEERVELMNMLADHAYALIEDANNEEVEEESESSEDEEDDDDDEFDPLQLA